MTDKKEKISALMLEQYALDELPPKQRIRVENELKENPALQKELDNIKNSNNTILAEYPPETTVPQLLEGMALKQKQTEILNRQQTYHKKRLFLALPAMAVVMVMLFFLIPTYKWDLNKEGATTGPSTPNIKDTGFKDTIRLKGDNGIDTTHTGLVVYRQNQGTVELLKNETKAKKGDLIQLAYVATDCNYGVIFSIDGNGMVTLHHPSHPTEPTTLEKNKIILLDNAYELDDAPMFERFFLITSNEKLNVETIMDNAEKMAADIEKAQTETFPLKPSMKQHTFMLRKEEQK